MYFGLYGICHDAIHSPSFPMYPLRRHPSISGICCLVILVTMDENTFLTVSMGP